MSEELEHIRIVKQRYEQTWYSIKGVVAVGIGRVGDSMGIIISTEHQVEEIQTRIPTIVEGIPVRIQFSGTITAQEP